MEKKKTDFSLVEPSVELFPYMNSIYFLPFSYRFINISDGTQIHKSNDGLLEYYLLYLFMPHIHGLVCYFSIQRVFTYIFSLLETVMKVSDLSLCYCFNGIYCTAGDYETKKIFFLYKLKAFSV